MQNDRQNGFLQWQGLYFGRMFYKICKMKETVYTFADFGVPGYTTLNHTNDIIEHRFYMY